MKKIWQYSLGKWIEDAVEIEEWPDKEDFDFEDYLDLLGYERSSILKMGEDFDVNQIIIYGSKESHEGQHFLGDMPTFNGSFYFQIADKPSMLIFCKEYSEINEATKKFIRTDTGFCIRKDLIGSYRIQRSRTEETVVFNINDTEQEFFLTFQKTERKDKPGEFIGGRAETWLNENLLGWY